MDIKQLVTKAEAAKIKGMELNLLNYHLSRPNAPQPVAIGIGEHQFYELAEIKKWKPNRKKERKKPKP